jgi:hypothetical protein
MRSDDLDAMKTDLRRPLVVLAVAVLGAAVAGYAPRLAAAQQQRTATVRVDAGRPLWKDTTIELAEGETADFTATGLAGWLPGIQVGPDGARVGTNCRLVAPDAPVGALLGRVGNGPPVLFGSSGTVAGPGHINVLYNDCPGQYFDNNGFFQISLTVAEGAASQPPEPPAIQATVEAPAEAPAAVAPKKDGGRRFDPWIPLVFLAVAGVGVGAFYGRRYLPALLPRSPVVQFSPSARLESSAWLAPVRLRTAQGERRPKKFLNIGGPDSDIDFGLPGVWARIHPTEDGGARLEAIPNKGRILVDGKPIVMGQRLASGSRVFMNTREFVFRADADESGPSVTALNRRGHALSHPDPRITAMGE